MRMSEQTEYLTLPQVARRVDRADLTLRRAVKYGRIAPDTRVGRYMLFKADRIDQIRQALNHQPQEVLA